MQPVEPGRVQSAINVTPLVDVVLVLLIIFMVVAPQLEAGPDVKLPATDRPDEKPDDGRRIEVSIDRGGGLWIDGGPVAGDRLVERVRGLALEQPGRKIVIKADAALSFGDVQQVMLAVESAGIPDIGLITERREEPPPGA